MIDESPTRVDQLLTALACLAGGIVVGGAYTLAAPPLNLYAPFSIDGWLFGLFTFACAATLGAAIGRRRVRAAMASSSIVASIAAALHALLIALPAIIPVAPNATGLVNYALTQAIFPFFIVLLIGFPGGIVGLLGNYLWHDR